MEDIIILKFGGSSVSNNENLKIVANKIIDFKNNNPNIVVILSAQGKTTDKLINEAYELTEEVNKRELDALVSCGEQMSAAKLSILLNSLGFPSVSLTGWQAGIYTNNTNQDALIELTNKVVEQYNADSNRISLSGHSQGAIGGYSIISRHPDYFSAFIPISGHTNKVDDTESAWESISNVKIWAFHGTSDDAVSYRYVTNIQNKLQEMGADSMTVYTFKNEGHNIQNKVFTNEYEYSDGEMYNPIDWALSQEKSDN